MVAIHLVVVEVVRSAVVAVQVHSVVEPVRSVVEPVRSVAEDAVVLVAAVRLAAVEVAARKHPKKSVF